MSVSGDCTGRGLGTPDAWTSCSNWNTPVGSALCDGTASAFYGDLMSEDGVMVLADGSVMTRDDVVTALAEAPPWSSYDIDDPRCVPLGDAAAALVYTGTGRRDGSDDFVGVMTSVYVRRDGRWALALFQQTPKP